MMLDWLGERETADRIRAAVQAVFADPSRRTADLGGSLTTRQMGDAVIDAL